MRDPAEDLAAAWLLLPDDGVDALYAAYRPAADDAMMPRARGRVAVRALRGVHVGDNGDHGRPRGKLSRGPTAHAALRQLAATA